MFIVAGIILSNQTAEIDWSQFYLTNDQVDVKYLQRWDESIRKTAQQTVDEVSDSL